MEQASSLFQGGLEFNLMKLVIKLNIIFLAAIMLLVPLADMASCGSCLAPTQENTNIRRRGKSSSVPVLISSAHCSYCKPNDASFQNNSHLCPVCNNSMPLLSSSNHQVNLLSSFFRCPEKIAPALEIYSNPYIPPKYI